MIYARYDGMLALIKSTLLLNIRRLIKLNSMKASEELNAEEKRQLEFDLESNYTAFRGWLDNQ